LLVVTSCNW